jgi:signal transduction histidine kinase
VAFTLVNFDLMFMYPAWETIPFHLIWTGLALFYGFRPWKAGLTLAVVTVITLATAAGIEVDVRRGFASAAELIEDPLLALMFFAMVWHARRRIAAESSHRLIATQIARLLADQRRFLQDAAHQLKTPITIALGHAELLSGSLGSSSASGQEEDTDIEVIIGELNQLRRISEHLLVIAAAGDPEFLHPEPVALDRLADGLLTRWQATADRSWKLGAISRVIVPADRERLSLALDALLENAVQHTVDGDAIELSVTGGPPATTVRIAVADTGNGIAADQLPRIFDRFRSGGTSLSRPSRGTGLGLALVDAVASAHGGMVTVRSEPGQGSEFTLVLPVPAWPSPPAEEWAAADGTGLASAG